MSGILRPAEFVLPGHPDKIADAIADRIVHEASKRERRALVGIEVALYRDVVFIDGRIACRDADAIDMRGIVRSVYAGLGYGEVFGPAPRRIKVKTDVSLGPLSRDEAKFREISDDQVISVGYACSTPGTDMRPVEHALGKRLAGAVDALRQGHPSLGLGPDGKVIVLVRERRLDATASALVMPTGDAAQRAGRVALQIAPPTMQWQIEAITTSIQHRADWDAVRAHRAVRECLLSEARGLVAIVPGLSLADDLDLRINPLGDFVEGGPFGDNGLSGKKLVMDAYGPRVPIGGGATAGKDRWKADVRGFHLSREIAVGQILRRGCRVCTVTLAINPGDREFRVAAIERG
jgi:S-adenosylmethionine synthetase